MVNLGPPGGAGPANAGGQAVGRELLRQAGRIWCGSMVMLIFLIPAIAGAGAAQWILDRWLPPAASLLVTIAIVSAPLTALAIAAAIGIGDRLSDRGQRPLKRG